MSKIKGIQQELLWKDFIALADFFSPAIRRMQQYAGVESREILYTLGTIFGRRVAERSAARNLDELLAELSRAWEEYEIGRLQVERREPLTLTIYNCTICGQVAGTGEIFDCPFHEGFFDGVLSTYLGRDVKVIQETNFKGEAGTWCRRYVVQGPP
jgi:predicted hydrocarbon binding protein